MAAKIVLKLNGTALNLTNDKFDEDRSSVDSLNTSEAGTTLRAVIRTGIKGYSVSYTCIETDKILLDGFNDAAALTATIYDETTAQEKTWRCFMSNYKASLVLEDNSHRFYKVSFKLNDLEN